MLKCQNYDGSSSRFVEAVLNSVIEKAAKARVASGGLIAAMLSRGLLGEVNNLPEIGPGHTTTPVI